MTPVGVTKRPQYAKLVNAWLLGMGHGNRNRLIVPMASASRSQNVVQRQICHRGGTLLANAIDSAAAEISARRALRDGRVFFSQIFGQMLTANCTHT